MVALGYTQDLLGRPEDALATFQTVLSGHRVPRPDTLESGLAAGGIAQRLGKYSDANDAYRAVLRLAPKTFEALAGLGLAAASEENWAAAKDRFAQALRVRPHDEVIAQRLAEVEARMVLVSQ